MHFLETRQNKSVYKAEYRNQVIQLNNQKSWVKKYTYGVSKITLKTIQWIKTEKLQVIMEKYK